MLDNYIDFDEASREWRKNKRALPNGNFEYICNYIHTNGKRCRYTILSCLKKKHYVCDFGDNISVDKYKYHPNRDYYCKKHINRYRPLI